MSMMYYPDGIDDPVRRIVELSREFGGNPAYVLAGGGNTSVKDDSDLYVKASGTQLATIDADGFVRMSRRDLDAIWDKQYPADADQREEAVLTDMMAARSIPGDTRRPSVECLMHTMFPYRFVVHTHPALVNGITCSVRNESAAREILGDDLVWLPVIDPGYVLARHVKDAVEAHTEKTGIFPKLVLLQNHGIFVAADSEAEIREIYRMVFAKISEQVGRTPAEDLRELTDTESAALAGRVAGALPGAEAEMFANSDIDELVADADAFAELTLSVTPDHIVYFGYRPLFVGDEDDLEKEIAGFARREGFPPRIIAIRGRGVMAVHENEKKRTLARQLFLDNVKIAIYTRSFGGIQFMPEANINFIRTWEAEKYRASQAR
jgi:rhamnose utilization protein RhaD (predicted bifunctional aldolase and dehydrogenase)